MDVRKSNFLRLLPQITRAIQTCDFVAIDAEFSGLNTGKEREPWGLDTCQERYEKIKEAGEQFALLQFGICLFTRSQVNEEEIIAEPYNFWVYPSSSHGSDDRLLFQTGSVEFLTQCNFDFNMSFREGIPYLTRDRVDILRKEFSEKSAKLLSTAKTDSKSETINLSTIRAPHVKNLLAEALNIASQISAGKDQASGLSFEVDEYGRKYVVLHPMNGYVRRLVYQEVQNKFKHIHVGKFHFDNTNSRDGRLRLTVCSDTLSVADMESSRIEESLKTEQESLDLCHGMGKIIQIISESKKPVVGHNCMLDLTHVLSKFERPLPPTVEEFRVALNEIFPIIIDTKHVYSTDPQLRVLTPDTSLNGCNQSGDSNSLLKGNLSITMGEGFTKYSGSGDSYHEAGYDAFVTGKIFARAMCLITSSVSVSESLLKFHESGLGNHLFLMRQDFSLNLVGPLSEPDMANVIRLSNFPEKTKTYHLQKLITEAIPGIGSVRITWDSDTSAFANPPTSEDASWLVQQSISARNSGRRGKSPNEFANKKFLTFADVDIDLALKQRTQKDTIKRKIMSDNSEGNFKRPKMEGSVKDSQCCIL